MASVAEQIGNFNVEPPVPAPEDLQFLGFEQPVLIEAIAQVRKARAASQPESILEIFEAA